jgi:hypothetical protein
LSRASAYIQATSGERVAYGIYCGTSDVLMPHLSDNRDELWDVFYERKPWRGGLNPWDTLAACNHELEVGYAYSDYGGGFYWPVKFCRECMVVHGPLDWDAMDEQLVKPSGPKQWWPLDGEPPIETTAADAARWLLPDKAG